MILSPCPGSRAIFNPKVSSAQAGQSLVRLCVSHKVEGGKSKPEAFSNFNTGFGLHFCRTPGRSNSEVFQNLSAQEALHIIPITAHIVRNTMFFGKPGPIRSSRYFPGMPNGFQELCK